MKFTKLVSTVVGVIAIAMASPSHADLYRVTSIAAGMSAFVVNTAIAKVVG